MVNFVCYILSCWGYQDVVIYSDQEPAITSILDAVSHFEDQAVGVGGVADESLYVPTPVTANTLLRRNERTVSFTLSTPLRRTQVRNKNRLR